nr:PKD domain-containing protein [Naasia aerilata]
MIATSTSVLPPSTLSVEAWFKTNTTAGGKIVGFGNMATGNSTNNYDRDITMNSNGQLVFGVRSGATTVSVTTTARYNNNGWHHAVGTVGSNGLQIFVDGVRVAQRTGTNTAAWTYPGFWRIGGDTTASGVKYFNGTVDEVAVYDRQLDAATVKSHYDLGTSGAAINVAPTASFTAKTANLDVTVDGSGSTDSDGTIASYAWSFGDGGTATGATATHSYATAGTYTVTLTVTDNGGATATRTATVSPTDPPVAGAVLAQDGFGRTATNGLGTAETGGLWSVVSPASAYSVASGAAQVLTPAGSTRTAYLGTVNATDNEAQATVAFSVRPTSGSAYASVQARRVGSAFYQARVVVASSGAVQLQLQQSSTTLRTVSVSGLTYAAGDSLRVRVQAIGTSPTTLQAKVWKVGTTEPTAWTATTTDSTAALQAAGSVGISSYLSASASPASYTVSFDDFWAGVVSATPPPPANAAPTASFTSATNGLGVSVDGSASADSDGTIAAYSWNWETTPPPDPGPPRRTPTPPAPTRSPSR